MARFLLILICLVIALLLGDSNETPRHVAVLSTNVGRNSKGFWFVNSVKNVPLQQHRRNQVYRNRSACEIRIYAVFLGDTGLQNAEGGTAVLVTSDGETSPCLYVSDNRTYMTRLVSGRALYS